MKFINDIYDVLLKGPKVSKEKAKEIIDQAAKDYAEELFKRLVERPTRKGSPTLRMSNIGRKPRQLWFMMNCPEVEEEPSSDSLFRFLDGALEEIKLIALTRLAGHEVHSMQKGVELHGIKGSLDAYIGDTLVDFKSASDQGFQKFKKEGLLHSVDPFGYIGQLSGYAAAEGKTEALFLVKNKNSGELAEYWIDEFDIDSFKMYLPELQKVLNKDTPPEEYCYSLKTEGETNKKYLNNNCRYCPYINQCWGERIEEPKEDYKDVKKIYVK